MTDPTKSLMDIASGCYRVTTRSSTYEIDLDSMVVGRLPRTGDPIGALLRRDERPVMLLSIYECTVGRPMLLLVDLGIPGVDSTIRRSTEVTTIEPIDPVLVLFFNSGG